MTQELSPKESALLNKIYRAVHDGVCPNCGNDIQKGSWDSYTCSACEFNVSAIEMRRMQVVVSEWGKEAVQFFHHWRSYGGLGKT